MTKLRTLPFGVALILAFCSSASAAEPSPALEYLAGDVLGMAFVELAKLDLETGANELLPLVVPRLAPEEMGEQRATAVAANEALKELKGLGARRVIVPLRVTNFLQGPTFILEVDDPAQAEKIVTWLMPRLEKLRDAKPFGQLPIPAELAAAGRVVLGASTAAQLDDLKKRSSQPNAAVAEVFERTTAQDAGIVLWGDPDSRRVTREMFPALPAPFTEINGALLADGLKSIGVTLKLPPQPTATITIEAADEKTAKTLDAAAAKAIVVAQGLMIAELATGPPSHKADAAQVLPILPLLAPKISDHTLTITFGDDQQEVAFVKGALSRAVSGAHQKSTNMSRMNQFKQIALGMLNYDSAKGSYPPAASYDDQGKPLLSWRVLILPYIEQGELYEKFHLDEPWDSEHNRKLIDEMPPLYLDPDYAVRAELREKGSTSYLVPTGEGLLFDGREGTTIRNVQDGTSNTILLVEVVPERAVVWTKPGDWEVDLRDPLKGLTRTDRELIAAAFADGSVRLLHKVVPDNLRAMLTRNGHDTVK